LKGISMDRLTVLAMFSWEYLVMAFLACLGVVQMAAARSGRRHLWLLSNRKWTTSLGIVLILAGIAFFYLIPLSTAGPWGPPNLADGTSTWAPASAETLTGARNINDTAGGLSGHWQALWFVVAWIGAVLVARTFGRRQQPTEEPPGRDRRVLVGASSGDRA
jgi:hypothetical protein